MLRSSIGWEIGLSIKHNHFAVKHSRLAKTLDFSGKWFGHPCTNAYWDCISKVFEYLDCMKKQGRTWSELPSKDQDVYVPLLKAFMDEINRQNEMDLRTPKNWLNIYLVSLIFIKS